VFPENSLSYFIEIATKFKTDFEQHYNYIIKSCDLDIDLSLNVDLGSKWNRYTFHCYSIVFGSSEHFYLIAEDNYEEIYELIDI
jgi:hypothetical protein